MPKGQTTPFARRGRRPHGIALKGHHALASITELAELVDGQVIGIRPGAELGVVVQFVRADQEGIAINPSEFLAKTLKFSEAAKPAIKNEPSGVAAIVIPRPGAPPAKNGEPSTGVRIPVPGSTEKAEIGRAHV